MEQDLQKRNTDCVYFLASPLTCKKGLDCEYRHSEIARLNPRDCWYWLSANCLNPTCAFRHPPLDAHAEAPPGSAQLPHQCSVPNNKTSVPCYFYFKGFCNKGDKCSFSHGSDGSAPCGKSSKTASATTDALSSANKTSTGNDTGSVPIETHLSPSETAPTEAMNMVFQPKENLQPPAPKIVQQRSASPQMSVPECKELPIVKSESLFPAEGFIQSRSHLCTDQSSDEQVDDHIELEERWESSPGFDVLVDNKSENLGYEDDPEYLLALDREHGELHSHFLGYDFKDPVEYDPTYPDAELLYEREIYDSYDLLDNELIFDEATKIPGHSRERMLDSILSRKRKLLQADLADDQKGVDLRDHLRKRRVIDGHPITRLSGRHNSSRLIDRSQERPRRHGMAHRLRGRSAAGGLHGRLASEVGKNTIESLGDNGTLSNGSSQNGWHGHSQSNTSRHRYKEKKLAKRQFLPSEISKKKPVSRGKRRSTEASSTFTGPKTLAQIKEEKNKAEENGNYFGKMTSADFQAPKPLSEILKDKKNHTSSS